MGCGAPFGSPEFLANYGARRNPAGRCKPLEEHRGFQSESAACSLLSDLVPTVPGKGEPVPDRPVRPKPLSVVGKLDGT